MKTELYMVVRTDKRLIEKLIENGFEKRSGSVAYYRENIAILPERKWFWETDDKCTLEYTNYFK